MFRGMLGTMGRTLGQSRGYFLWLISALCLSITLSSYSAAQTAVAVVATYHNDKGRSGNNLLETTLTPNNVNPTQFGKLFSQFVDGFIYAQPLYVPNVNVAGLGTHNVV